MFKPSLLLLSIAPAFACTSTSHELAPTPTPAAPVDEQSVREGLNDNFLATDLDVQEYVERFEGESREIATSKTAILAVLDISPGLEVADIGAGTGLFLSGLAHAVGDEGKVYAVDISPGFQEHIEERIRSEGLSQVQPILCTSRSTGLPDASVDLVFVCDTYHHFEFPMSTLASIHRALRPGGRMVVVDFERIPGVTREWLLDHVRADKATFRSEIEAAGFMLQDEVEVEGLEENYVLRFLRP